MQFFSLDFALTWVPLWLAVWLTATGKIAFNTVFMAIAAISATLAAIIIIYSSKDRQLIKDYWNRVCNIRRINLKWWPLLIFMLPTVNAIAISTFFGHSADQFQLNEALLASPTPFLLLLLFYGPVPEELGWRGYGLDSLRTRYNLLNSSLMLALFWSIWHIPFFFLPGSYQNQLLAYPPGCIAFFIALIPTEIIIDWIYYKNNRSTLSAIVFHFMINFSGEAFIIDQFTKVIQMGLLLVIAIAIVVIDRKMFLQKEFRISF